MWAFMMPGKKHPNDVTLVLVGGYQLLEFINKVGDFRVTPNMDQNL